jgi:hypothetical protein
VAGQGFYRHEHRLRLAEALNRPMEGGILVQRSMIALFIIIGRILAQNAAQVRQLNSIMCSRYSRQIVPISLSAYAFCHGEPGAMGLSRIPMARNRRDRSTVDSVPQSRMR